MTGKTAVIIPYYQEEPGILRDAVVSAMAQEGVTDLEIIVVDDGSPVPARDDLRALDLPAHVTLKLIEQPNRGPGAARNRALDSLSADTVYVAFLDSDDRWTSNHLRSAHSTLLRGYDMYFADFRFSRLQGTILTLGGIDEISICVDDTKHHYVFRDHPRKHLINPRSFIHTSTVVYRYDRYYDLRFPEEFALGEDTVFWLSLAERTDKIVFCSDVECTSGPGVHIWESGQWGDPRLIWCHHQQMQSRKWIGAHFAMDRSERKEHARRIDEIRRSFIRATLHEFRRNRALKNTYILPFLMTDPAVVLYVLPGVIQSVMIKIRRLVRIE